MGIRNLLLTQEVIDEAVGAVKAGLYMETVAAIVGVHITTFRGWLCRGSKESRRLHKEGYPVKASEALYLELSEGLKKALGDQLLEDLQGIRTAGSKSWQALAWLIERRYSAMYGARAREIQELTAEEKEQAKAEKKARRAPRSTK